MALKQKNLISAYFHDVDQAALTVMMVIDGEPKAWIDFDIEQLDGLLRLLENKRKLMLRPLAEKSQEPHG